jgi:citrate lyase subunit beta/citryl-CoA lyase
MRLRCLLFVPGDQPDRMEKALGSGADALILDLEDAVAVSAKPAARAAVAAFVACSPRTSKLFVRINPLASGMAAADLDAVLPARPDGLVLPKAEGAASISALAEMLKAYEAIKVLPITTETPSAIFGLATYATVRARLAGLTWGAEDLSAAIGAAASREPDGAFTAPYQMVRSLALFAAHAAGVPAIETVFPAFGDLDGLAAFAARARRDGFSGMMAVHPAQVPIIRAAFTPSEDERAHAQAVVDAFSANPRAGVLRLEGEMIDAPHLKQALSILRQSTE